MVSMAGPDSRFATNANHLPMKGGSHAVRAGHAKQGVGNTSLTCPADLAQGARWTPTALWLRVLFPKGLGQTIPAIVVDFLRKPALRQSYS